MPQTLIPAELLKKSNKILFIAHLALGDFTYLQNFFQAFARANPHLEVHLWVDEVRRTSDTTQWGHLQKYALYDWVEACPFFHKIYRRTYSPALYEESIREAQQEQYPIVVSLATLRPHLYAELARSISPDGLVIGMRGRVKLLTLHHLLAYRKLNASFAPFAAQRDKQAHITDVYADWFSQLSGLQLMPGERFPFVDIPAQWNQYASEKLASWGVQGLQPRDNGKLVFINPYAKTKKRCWTLEQVAELIVELQHRPQWRDSTFIVNAVPQELAHARSVIGARQLQRTELFSAEENFFQLPAILAQCDLIISVETAVMHLANAVHVPVIALMRQKNPEWVPFDHSNSIVITAARRRDWVKAVAVEQVLKVIP
ncbi:ADP-heptose:LPS heptosyltransferase [Herbaspirillum sp. Sphag1AN]|uniref:glycosyltransferase family 9 protein n=1 Tax=unclassified Herbaspirillum TaxID=2624150 RepID=UPI0016182315|nr:MULTISPECIES: glycosyltransferase family 9 protein [unclassified Herbaspirillum]MBB3214126.1 ADP-heptose:LPS heptosyltransferase [Herbaspirillum sp. Sphag1AN]MBB3247787.1 ADP-heptose:LPS heptosyltransferase [Herbaspirillum sp. Sphag64]